jgi:aspartate/methionine/tyrosine aminotransferase
MKFSSRLPVALDDNALARAVAQRRAKREVIYDLTLSNPTEAGFTYPQKEIAAGLAAGAKVAYAPEPRGLLSTRKAIAALYRGRGPDAVDPVRLHLTASTSEAYGFLFKLLGEPGAEVLAPTPSYPLIEHLASLEGWKTKHYPLVYKEGRWRMDFAAISAAITPATRVIAIIHPHNPTGWMVRNTDAHFLLETCEKHNIALIVDEVFLDYATDANKPLAQSFAAHQTSATTFTLGGLSKSCGLPQLKLGWICVGGPKATAEAAQARLDFITDAYLSVSTPVQAALPKLFSCGKKIRRQIQKRLDANYATLTSFDWPEGFLVLPHHAGWCALLQRPSAPDEEALALKLLDRAGVLAHPGYFFDFPVTGPAYHVLSLLPAEKTFRTGVKALHDWLPKLV